MSLLWFVDYEPPGGPICHPFNKDLVSRLNTLTFIIETLWTYQHIFRSGRKIVEEASLLLDSKHSSVIRRHEKDSDNYAVN